MSNSYRRGCGASAKVCRVISPLIQPGADAFAITAEAGEISYLLAIAEAEKCCQNVADVFCTADIKDNTAAHFQSIVNVDKVRNHCGYGHCNPNFRRPTQKSKGDL